TPFLFESCVRYHPQAFKTPSAEHWKATDKKTDKASVCPEPVAVYKSKKYRPWWEVFDDPILSDLEMEACANSPSVASAVARLKEQKASYITALKSLFQKKNLNASPQREPLSSSQLAPRTPTPTTASTPTASTTPVVIPSITPTAPSVTVMPT